MSFQFKTMLGATVATLALGQAGAVFAQTAAPPAVSPTGQSTDPTTEVVVTGHPIATKRTKAQTSYSVTNINEEALRLQAPTSVTEALKSVPGFWVEASGGEASGNVRARGVPVDGFGSITLLEDGVAVAHDPALGYLNVDQEFRLDETIERIEVVRGGPSAIFYSNAPAGAVNFIPRKVGDHAEGLIKGTLGQDGLYRTDFWYGAPVGDWKVSVGGFYRAERGVRDPGYTGNHGGQIRGTISRDFDRGSFSLDYKHLDDTVIFYTPIPMYTNSSNKIVGVPGLDANYDTLAGPETDHVVMKTGNGSTYNYDNTLGTSVKRDQLTAKFQFEVAPGWHLTSSARYSDTHTQRNGLYANALLTGASFIQQNQAQIATVPGATGLQLRYTDNASQLFGPSQNGNGDITVAGLRGITMPVQEFINDNQLTHRFTFGSQTHDVTAGYYFAHIQESFNRYSSSYLTDVENHARLLDLVAVDASGNPLKTLTDHGVWRYGYEWANASSEQTTNALYLADEWQIMPQLRIDAGARYEMMNTSGSMEQTQTVNLGTLSASQILEGTGQFLSYDRTYDKIAWTAGADWQFNRASGLFIRWTESNRLPSLGNFLTSPTAKPIIQTMNLGEAGYKFHSTLFDVYATAFYTKYNNVGFSNYIFNPQTGASTSQSLYANTKTYGVEFEGVLRPVEWFDISGTATLEDPKYKGLTYTDSAGVRHNFDGNQLIRVPRQSLRIVPGFNLLDSRLRLQGSWEYEGRRFSDTANSVVLPAYSQINLTARWQINERTSLYGYVDNLTNSMGLTEGNPRAGEILSADAGANAFIARPLLGRNYRVALMYRF